MAFRVAERDGKFRVVKDGEPQPSVDDGGFKSKQKALDAAMKANKKDRKLGKGKADEARGALANRGNQVEAAINKATK